MSAWCEDRGFEGAAMMLREHAAEEMTHMNRLFTYVSETGALPILGSIDAGIFRNLLGQPRIQSSTTFKLNNSF